MYKNLSRCLFHARNFIVGTDTPDIDALSTRTPRLYFGLCIALYVVYVMAMQPVLLFGGEMWAEMATNYYANAGALSLVTRLFSTDAGYVPLPQRLIAQVFEILSFPASSIPFAYSWTAVLLTAAMVGSFCLSPFRRLVQSDGLRLVVSLIVLALADYETRTFINFTYFSAFFVAVLSGWAIASPKDQPIAWWAWFTPILMMSKPAVLATLPGLLLAALISRNRRFQCLTALAAIACGAQALQLMLSRQHGTFAATSSVSFLEKVYAGGKYALGYLSTYATGMTIFVEAKTFIITGVLLSAVLIAVIIFRKRPSNALIVIGGLAIIFNMLINAMALSDSWTSSMSQLPTPGTYRHVMVAMTGAVLLFAGFAMTLFQPAATLLSGNRSRMVVVLFGVWFVAAGWVVQAGRLNQQPVFPALNASYWRSMAAVIDSGAPVCVPINPLGWYFERGCSVLSHDLSWAIPLNFQSVQLSEGTGSLKLPVPSLPGHNILAIGIAIKPEVPGIESFSATVVLTLKDGSSRYLTGATKLSSAGALLLVATPTPISLEHIAFAELRVDAPVAVGRVSAADGAPPALTWIGQ